MQRFTPRHGWRRRFIPVPWNLTRSTVTYLLFWYGCLLGIINLRVFFFFLRMKILSLHCVLWMTMQKLLLHPEWRHRDSLPICYEWWHRDSLNEMNDDAEIHYMLLMMTQRFTICYEWWRRDTLCAINDDGFTICNDWWHSDSFRAINADTAVHPAPRNLAYDRRSLHTTNVSLHKINQRQFRGYQILIFTLYLVKKWHRFSPETGSQMGFIEGNQISSQSFDTVPST